MIGQAGENSSRTNRIDANSIGCQLDRRRAGEWNEAAQRQVDTICPYCGVGCTLTLHVQDDEIVKVTSPYEHDITRGNLCIKGRFGWRYVQNRDGSETAAKANGGG